MGAGGGFSSLKKTEEKIGVGTCTLGGGPWGVEEEANLMSLFSL